MAIKHSVVKAYQEYLDNPFADGYTVAYLESKYGMTIDEMRKQYELSRSKNKLEDKDLLVQLGKIVGKSNAYLDNDSIIRKVRELLQDNGYI